MTFSFDLTILWTTMTSFWQALSPIIIVIGGLMVAVAVITLFIGFVNTRGHIDRRFNPFRSWWKD